MCNVRENERKNILIYVLSFTIPVVCMLILMALKECYPFGSKTFLLGDSGYQYFAFFREWLENLEDGGSFLFNWNGGLGYDFYTTYWYYLASPFNWIILLFGQKYLELGMITVMLIQVGGCGVTSCYYFIHSKINKMKKGMLNNLLCVLFSLAFSMCDFILAYQYNIMWLISLMLMPIVLLGIEKLVGSNDGRLYGVSLSLVFITNFYFAWFICLFAIIWFVDQKEENIKTGLKSFLHFLEVSVLSSMCAAAVLIPCYLFVLERESKVSENEFYDLGNIGNFFQGFFWGYKIDTLGSDTFNNNNYCGIFVIFLAIVFVFNKKIDLRKRIKRILEITVISFSLNFTATQYIFHGFTLPHGYSSRFTFILIFILIITAFEAISGVETIRIRYTVITIVLFATVITVVLVFNNNVQGIWCYLITILIFIYLSVCLIFLKRKSIKKNSFIINMLVIGFLEIIINSFMVASDEYGYVMEKELQAEEWYDKYIDMASEDGERKTAYMYDMICFQYSDTDVFSSIINTDIINMFGDLGLTYSNNNGSFSYRGTTPLTTALFNVDYVLTDSTAYFGGYELEQSYSIDSSDNDYGLYTTSYNSELGFMISENILDWNTEDENPFEVQNNFTDDVLNQGNIFTEADIEELQIYTSGCIITGTTDNDYAYTNVNLSDEEYAYIEVTFVVPYDMHLYVYVNDINFTLCQIYIDNELYHNGHYWYPGVMLDFGELKEGQTVIIDIYNNSSILEEGVTSVDFYTYNDEIMQNCLSIINENPLVLDTCEDTYVLGTVTAEEDGVLYTSIPYYKGWTLYVDGEETEITKIADALVGVELTAGEHTIELKYFPYGLKVGIIISVIGIFGMIIYFLNYKRKKSVLPE